MDVISRLFSIYILQCQLATISILSVLFCQMKAEHPISSDTSDNSIPKSAVLYQLHPWVPITVIDQGGP